MVSTQIRSRKITATEQLLGKKDFNPVSPRFDAKQLRNKAAEIAGRSDRDLALVDYAIWTATKIKALNDRRLNHPVHRLRPMDRLQVLLALVSYEIWRVQRDARKQVEVGEGGITSTIDAVDTMRSGLKLRSHEVLESAIDGFNYAVVDALREAKLCLDEGDEAPRIDEMNGADVIEYVNFGTSYRVLYERWQRVFLLGADVRRDHYKWWITADPARAKRNAVGESRRYRQAASEDSAAPPMGAHRHAGRPRRRRPSADARHPGVRFRWRGLALQVDANR